MKRLILFFLIILSVSLADISPVSGQTFDWCYTYNVENGLLESMWQPATESGVRAAWESGLGWTRGSFDWRYIHIKQHFGQTITIAQMQLWYTSLPENRIYYSYPWEAPNTAVIDDTPSKTQLFENMNLTTDSLRVGADYISTANGKHLEQIRLYGYGASPFPSNNCVSTPELIKPLSTPDEEIPLTTNSGNPNVSTLAFSNTNYAYVHAPDDGYVSFLRPIINDDCDNDLGTVEELFGFWEFHCNFVKPNGDYRAFRDVETGYPDAYIVGIQTSDYIFHYYLDSPISGALSVGDSITDGCVLGSVAVLRSANVNPTGDGLAAVSVFESGSQIDATSYFTVEPTGNTPCIDENETDYNDSSCLNFDPFLQDESVWSLSGVYGFVPYGGVNTATGVEISQVLNLDNTLNPTITIGFKTDSAILQEGELAGNLLLSIGDAQKTISLTSQYTSQTISYVTTSPNPDIGDFFTASVKNIGSHPVFIEFICISHGATSNPDSMQYCYFDDYSLQDKDNSWTVNATGFYLWEDGEIRLNGDISQALTLPAGDYTITAEVGLYHTSSYDHNPTTENLSLNFTFDTINNDLTPYVLYSGLEYNNSYFISSDFTLASETTGTATLATQFDAYTGVLGVVIRSVCIKSQNAPPFTESCGQVAKPLDDSFGAWIEYQWNNQNNFFQCDLMILLNQMYDLGEDFYNVSTWSIRWNMAFLDYGLYWFDNEFVGWMNGHFANMTASGQTGGQEASCDNIWCFLTETFISTMENVFKPIVDTFLGYVDLVFTWVLGLIQQLLNLLFSILVEMIERGFFGLNLTTSLWNIYQAASPIAPPGLPDCTMLTPDDHLWCAGIWTLDNTFYARTDHIFTLISPGEILNLFIISFGTINLAIWVFGRLIKTLFDMSKAI